MITVSGSGWLKLATKSNGPLAGKRSMRSFAIARICPARSAMCFGVNATWTSFRRRE